MCSERRNIAQPGLQWQSHLFGAKPTWTGEPSIGIIGNIASKHLRLAGDELCLAIPFTEGAFNKLYAITCSKGDFIFRVALPVAPKVKTLSGVATLAFVRKNTSIPVPQIVAPDPGLTNELGFEWILMERLHGRPLREKWHQLSWLKKGLVIQQVADFTAQLSRLRLSTIGSISRPKDLPTNGCAVKNWTIDEAVLPSFFVESHIHLPISRGPFYNSHAFVTAHLDHLQHDITTQLQSDDEDEQEDAEEMQAIHSQLSSILPQLIPLSVSDEPTTLYHRDLSANNILVNADGDLVGIVDWECLIAGPSWLSYSLPQFLEGPSVPISDVPVIQCHFIWTVP